MIVQMLDVHCPYRLLYTLQVIDALLSGENDHRLGGNPQNIARSILTWVVKFLDLGGLDHLLSLVTTVSDSIESTVASSLATDITISTPVSMDTNPPGTTTATATATKQQSNGDFNELKSTLGGQGSI